MSETYVTLVEDNEAEGEMWRHYIPVSGNELAIAQLDEAISVLRDDDDGSFFLDHAKLTTEMVNTRLSLADDTSYMAAHTKLEGTLRPFPTPTGGIDLADFVRNVLYKGGIENLMTK